MSHCHCREQHALARAVWRVDDQSAVFPNVRLKLDFATAGEPKFGNVGDPKEALRRLTSPETDRVLT